MKRTGKRGFFIVAFLIIALTFVAFFGVSNYYGDNRQVYVKGAEDIRWGIDIQGGVEAVFAPDIKEGTITNENMDAAKEIIEMRLLSKNITDSEVYVDYQNHQVIVRFPWESGESDFDPATAVKELGETALLTFCEGETQDIVVLSGGTDIAKAEAGVNPENGEYIVALNLTSQGTSKFAEATTRLAPSGKISIWMDQTIISAPTVNSAITNGEAYISGGFDAQGAKELADKINAGSLPFALTVDDSKLQIISPTLGNEALDVMLIAGIIAFSIICIMMLFLYKVTGFVACIALLGQVGGMIACVTGFFPEASSFTLTIPGIAGIILSIGMGVDANVIISERIKEEIRKGKTIDGAIAAGHENGRSAIIDGNVTVVIISVILMVAFGTPSNPLAWMFSWLGSSVTGSIYSFGYTLLTGVIFNMVMGYTATNFMLKGISRLKFLRNPRFYGGLKEGKEPKVRKPFDFVGNVKKMLIIPIAIALVGVVFAIVGGVNLDINFKGGSRFTFTYENEVNVEEFKQTIEDKTGFAAEVTESAGLTDETSSKLIVSLTGNEAITADVQSELVKALQEKFADNKIELGDSNTVNPTVAGTFFAKAIFAIFVAAALVTVYIGFRFRKIGGVSASLMAFLALAIDCVMAFCACICFGLMVDMNLVAVILTLLGYSLNGTIGVYDRIRENKALATKMSSEELVNTSIRQIFRRSLVTSIATVLAIVVVIVVAEVFGVTSLRSLTIPMSFGLASGCLTSMCISAPLWVRWVNRKKAKKA